jgi:hypothetical protein
LKLIKANLACGRGRPNGATARGRGERRRERRRGAEGRRDGGTEGRRLGAVGVGRRGGVRGRVRKVKERRARFVPTKELAPILELVSPRGDFMSNQPRYSPQIVCSSNPFISSIP